jgi:hypothetical protein
LPAMIAITSAAKSAICCAVLDARRARDLYTDRAGFHNDCAAAP